MNKVLLTGRLTKDPELRKTNNNKSVLNFNLACNRKYKQDNETVADFPSCIVWNQSAEYLASYAHKGDLIEVEGSIQTRNYDGENGKVYITEVLCENVKILANKQNNADMKIRNDSWSKEPKYEVNGEYEDLGVDIETKELPFY